MALTPFWKDFLVTGGTTIAAVAILAILAWRLRARQRARPSQLGDILRRLSEEREAEGKSDPGVRRGDEVASADRVDASADHDLADLDHRR